MRAIAGSFLALILFTGVASAASISSAPSETRSTLEYCPPDYRGW